MTAPLLLRARCLVSMSGPPIEDGGVVVRDGRIAAAGAYREIRAAFPAAGEAIEVIDLGERAVLPALINAHCHLDYTGLRGKIPPPASFSEWIGAINALKRELGEADYRQAILNGFAELRRWGTGTVCNLAAFPRLIPTLPAPPIRTWWFPEMFDLRENAAELLASACEAIEAVRAARGCPGPEGSLENFGLSPHAPYTASPRLYRLCAETAGRHALPLTTHIAESTDEAAMFRSREGGLFALLERIGRPMDDCGGGSVFSTAVQAGLIGPGWILTHANELEEDDFALLARLAALKERSSGGRTQGWHFVHCPRSHAYFGHRPFPWNRLRALGATISLGTDSLASNDSLDLFAEMRAAQKSTPGLTSENLLETVTTEPARALGKAGQLGVIAPGAHADMIALPFAGPLHEVYDALVANRCPIEWMMLDGTLC